MNEFKNNGFITSHSINTHPLIRARKKTKLLYFAALEYLVKLYAPDAEYATAHLAQYRTVFVGAEKTEPLTDDNCAEIIRRVVDDLLKPRQREPGLMRTRDTARRRWRMSRMELKYRFILLCDIALIISEQGALEKARSMIAKYLCQQNQEKLKMLLEILYNKEPISPMFANVADLIAQFRLNRMFAVQPEIRIMVTANMSTGKSTLINAIIGKPVTKTSLEACTTDLCYLFNKPFEDGRIHLRASPLNLNATCNDLINTEKNKGYSIASFFRALGHPQVRICLIDTPGVNSAVNRNHGELTRKAIVEENYDKLIYVLNANILGTDDEINYLKYIYENVPNEKVIFVLNKLDCFKSAEDSISASIEGVKTDLQKIGYENPIICPLSAYFSLLLKMKRHNEELSEDEQDIFDLYVKKFNKPAYDLSVYHDKTWENISQNGGELLKMNFASGMYGLENILYGGTRD